jgi:membrane protein required for colicin V production
MDGADHLFAIILLVSGAVGFFRGFIREAIALLSWLVGLWLAWHFSWIVDPWLGSAIPDIGAREWAGRAVVLLLVLLFGALVGSVVSHFARRAVGLAAMDRTLGAAFGLVRGAIVIGLLVLAGRAVNLDLEPWWERTRSMPAAEAVANWLERYAAPAALEL